MNGFVGTLLVAWLVALPAPGAAAGAEGRSERVAFARGATAAEIRGEIKGHRYIDYRVRGGAGQTLDVEMKATNGAAYFNLLPPGSRDVAMFNGSIAGNCFSGVLPADGDYVIRAYLMRSAARRNESAFFTLGVGLTGRALAATPAARDARIPGTPFHASANIACALPYDSATKECEAFVIRRGFDGTATVEVRWGDDLKRRILFVRGNAVAADSPDAPTVEREGDVSRVRFGTDERFDIPDALLTGG